MDLKHHLQLRIKSLPSENHVRLIKMCVWVGTTLSSLPGESVDDQKVAHDAGDADGEDYSTNSVVCVLRDVYCGEELRGLMHHSNLQTQAGDGTLNNNFIMISVWTNHSKSSSSANESLLVSIQACIWTQAVTYSERNRGDIWWILIFCILCTRKLKQ